MTFFKKTLEYLFKLDKGKRFLALFVMAIPAGVGMALTAPVSVYKDWIREFQVGDLNFFSALTFNGVANPLRMVIAGAVTIILLLFSVSVMASVISRNLRVGVFSVNRLFTELNEAFIPTLSSVVTMALAVIVDKLLLGVLIVAFQCIPQVLLSLILSVVALVLSIALVSYIISLGILYLPYMTFNGLRPRVAFSESTSRFSGRKGGLIFLTVFIPVFFHFTLGALISIIGNIYVSFAVEAFSYTVLLVYLVALTFISYYEVNELPREDFPREYFFTKIKRR